MSKAITNYQLKREREKRGWSQARVAEQIDTAVVNVSRWERGYSIPSPYFREKLCRLYGKDAQDLGFIRQGQQAESVQQNSPLSDSAPIVQAKQLNHLGEEKPQQTSRILACLGYSFLWVSGIFVFLFAKRDRFARFHGLQSTLFFGGSNILLLVILAVAGALPKFVNNGNKAFLTIGFMLLLVIFALVTLFTLIGWIVGMVQAYRGNYYSFPFLYDLEERV